MIKTESLEEFYRDQLNYLPGNLQKNVGHFNVFRMEECVGPNARPLQYNRRDFYKIALIRGNNIYHYADKSLVVNGTALIFFNPQVPYTWQNLSEEVTGYFCIFSRSFFTDKLGGGLNRLPMYAPGGKPAYTLSKKQDDHLSKIFDSMLAEIRTEYTYKYDLLRTYLSEITHFALKSTPDEHLYKHIDAPARITSVFIELLERQFPIDHTGHRFKMRSAKDFAENLALHINHLNRAVKTTTGKTTTELIADRIIIEAKSMLKHTDWNISEIGYCLGFEEPSHFNNFFKKQTSVTPTTFRA